MLIDTLSVSSTTLVPAPVPQIPDYLTGVTVMEYVARLGGAMPDQIGALAAGTTTRELLVTDVARLERRVADLVRRGLLNATTIRSSLNALRATERWVYRPGPGALTPPDRPETGRILDCVRYYLSSTNEPAVPEPWLIHSALPGYSRMRNARWRLNELVRCGVLERERTRPRHFLTLVTLTRLGHAELVQRHAQMGREFPAPTRAPRTDQGVHHLLVVEAATRIMQRTRGDFIRLYGDESLRSASRKGRRMETGNDTEPLPDGQLIYRSRDGQDRSVNIEILVSKYTDAQILRKYATLGPSGTLFFACTRRLCDRVHRVTGRRPILLT